MSLHCAWCMYIYICLPLSVWLSQSMSPKAKWCLISTVKVRWHVAGFSLWKFGTLLECLRKAYIGTTTVQEPNLNPPPPLPKHAKPWKLMPKSCFTANLQKLRFYQNKWLSLDKRCRVPNTFLTRNQTSGPKNQVFFVIHIRLRKTAFFLNLGSIIKSIRNKWPIIQ